MKRWVIFSLIFLSVGSPVIAQQQRVVSGQVHSYIQNGIRHYSAKPPPPGSIEPRAINYSFIETIAGDPSARLLYRCSDNGVPLYTSKPYVGCVVIGNYRPQRVLATPAVPKYFGDHPCSYDCSGHEAGYAWAERQGVETPDECGGRSQSFIEGCESYAEEVQQELIESGDCEDSDQDELCD